MVGCCLGLFSAKLGPFVALISAKTLSENVYFLSITFDNYDNYGLGNPSKNSFLYEFPGFLFGFHLNPSKKYSGA
jgi:hypothetical protein